MSVGYYEWPGVLFISVWRASACSPGKELCCLYLIGRLDTELAQKSHSGIVVAVQFPQVETEGRATDIYRNHGPMLNSCLL